MLMAAGLSEHEIMQALQADSHRSRSNPAPHQPYQEYNVDKYLNYGNNQRSNSDKGGYSDAGQRNRAFGSKYYDDASTGSTNASSSNRSGGRNIDSTQAKLREYNRQFGLRNTGSFHDTSASASSSSSSSARWRPPVQVDDDTRDMLGGFGFSDATIQEITRQQAREFSRPSNHGSSAYESTRGAGIAASRGIASSNKSSGQHRASNSIYTADLTGSSSNEYRSHKSRAAAVSISDDDGELFELPKPNINLRDPQRAVGNRFHPGHSSNQAAHSRHISAVDLSTVSEDDEELDLQLALAASKSLSDAKRFT
jgi:hypothetical protein